MPNITLSAHGAQQITATARAGDETHWIDFVIQTENGEQLSIVAYFRGRFCVLSQEYAEAIAAVNARHPEISSDDEEQLSAA